MSRAPIARLLCTLHMINTEFLIVGQGISGTFLSWYLYNAGRSFIVMDNFQPNSASRVAAGIINPVTGRRIVRSWMIETLLPFAVKAYNDIGRHLGVNAIAEKKIVDFFPSIQMKMAFDDRIAQGEDYLSLPANEHHYNTTFNYDLGYGIINSAYVVNLNEILPAWRQFLKKEGKLIETKYDASTDQQITFEKIIFCDGIYSSTNTYFKNLPFALNKGEALVIEAADMPEQNIFKKGLTIAPLTNKLFWVGASHEWNFTDDQPSQQFYERTFTQLSLWLQFPFKVVERLASIRPATIERRPFVGIHPYFPSVGILNGFGTKGCSLAPYFAHQLVAHLIKNSPILAEANIHRFKRILQSSI